MTPLETVAAALARVRAARMKIEDVAEVSARTNAPQRTRAGDDEPELLTA